MRLFEFENPLAVKIASVVTQLKSEVESGRRPDPATEQDIISILRDNNVYVSSNQLSQMLNSPPLKNLISGITDKKVTFQGEEEPVDDTLPDMSDVESQEQQDSKIVSGMAKKASKNKPKLDLPKPDLGADLKPPPLPK
jgi:hypothetical protein